MQAARRRSDFDFTSRLGRRAEAGPRRVLPRVRPPEIRVPEQIFASTEHLRIFCLNRRESSVADSVTW
jgi:hypothetical protein